MNINMQSVMAKVHADINSEHGKERSKNYIRKCVRDGRDQTFGGSFILTIDWMHFLARSMIEILQKTAGAYDLPESVFNNIMSLTEDHVSFVMSTKKEDHYSIGLYFADDLSRPSLKIVGGGRTGEGIRNIISLFDTGTDIRTTKDIKGVWEGHEELGEVSATLWRPELHFMRDAVDAFNNMYQRMYGAYAYIPEGEYYAK